MSGQQSHGRIASLASLVILALIFSTHAQGQAAPEKKPAGKPERPPAADTARWQYLLEDLAKEARTALQVEKRPLLMAEVADAYWELDQSRSRELFMSALEVALSAKGDTEEDARSLRHVIKLAARRDAALARKLTEKVLAADPGQESATTEPISAATELLETDTAKAAQLAEANAPAGPSYEASWFLLQLARRDPAAADRVYAAYLNRSATAAGFGFERLLWLAGYPFGYAEAFGGSLDPDKMMGFSGLRLSAPGPRPALAQAFLDLALRVSQNALRQVSTSDPQRAEALNGFVLFTATYLLPEVQRYRPQALPAWALLEQQAQSGATATQKESVGRRVRKIFESRPRPDQREPPEDYADPQVEDRLARAEKLPSGCKRDVEFAHTALSIGYTKDFARAFDVAGRIDSESIKDSVSQYLYYDMAGAAAAGDDAAGLDDAQKYAERVSPPEPRAMLYVKIARAALRRHDRQLAAGLLAKTMRLAEAAPETASQASIQLAAAAGFSEFDPYEAYKALREGVKVVNSARVQNVEDFHVLRKVNLACRPGEDTWYGSTARAERFSLYESFAAMAGADVDGALSLARELNDPSIRIRSLISIARAMTKKGPR